MTRNNLTTDGSEFLLPDGKPYSGPYHVHVTEGAMEGARHTKTMHRSLTPVNEVVDKKVAIIQRGMRNESASTSSIPSTSRPTPRPQARRQRPASPMRRTPAQPASTPRTGSGY